MWLNRSGMVRPCFSFWPTCFLLFELQKLAGSLDCLIDFTNLNHNIFTKQNKSKCNSQKDYVFWPFPRVEPSVFFFGLQLNPKDIFTLWSAGRMSAMEQAVQENRSITKRESTIRLCAAVFLAILLLILLGFRSVSPQAAKDRVFRIAFCKF